MNNETKIAVGVAGGYVLGRFHKMKLAFLLAGVLAGRQLRMTRMDLLKRAAGALLSNREVSRLTDMARDRLVEAGKAAAAGVIRGRVSALTNRIGPRDSSSRRGSRRSEGDIDDDDDYDD